MEELSEYDCEEHYKILCRMGWEANLFQLGEMMDRFKKMFKEDD